MPLHQNLWVNCGSGSSPINSGEEAYLIIVTIRSNDEDIVTGLRAGADDYIAKPYNKDVLQARLNVGQRIIAMQQTLVERIQRLEQAQEYIHGIHGILSICSHCHKIRTDQNSWERLEQFMAEHADIEVNHGICSECMAKYYSDWNPSPPVPSPEVSPPDA